MAEQLGSDELRARSLSVMAGAKAELRDPTADSDFERALEIALDLDAPLAGTILASMTVSSFMRLDFRRATELLAETRRIAERLGDAAQLRWARYQQTNAAVVAGDWDQALQLADAFIAECERDSHVLEPDLRQHRGRIREARGDVEGALSDFRSALAFAREREMEVDLLASIGTLVLALEARPARDEVGRLALETMDLARTFPQEAVWILPFDFMLSRIAVEHEGELRTTLEDAQLPHWRELALACLDRDFVSAAAIWAAAGHVSMEARTRLRAAEELVAAGHRAEGERQLARALAFYRSVGANHFVERGEALLREARTA